MHSKGSNFILNATLPNPNEANSSLTYFTYYGPVADQESRVTSALLTQILKDSCFNVLRTREQLGYIVFSSNFALPGLSERGLRIVVQSEKKPGYLEERVEAFLDEMKTNLEVMSDAEFAAHRSALEKKWLEVDKNLTEEAERYLEQVQTGHWDFLRSMKPV
jgi:insulysin